MTFARLKPLAAHVSRKHLWQVSFAIIIRAPPKGNAGLAPLQTLTGTLITVELRIIR